MSEPGFIGWKDAQELIDSNFCDPYPKSGPLVTSGGPTPSRLERWPLQLPFDPEHVYPIIKREAFPMFWASDQRSRRMGPSVMQATPP